ncbi:MULTISPECIES: oxidoreductase [unclassified Ruegeria]|uniref:oxidoreductase n=1 Tax=unclassified Ruegeria TaxID=2625375 RepID=UPI001488E1D2|nr:MULTISPECIES: oxidoreductase [unclassified Ruegeria]NOD64794.1 SDR family NAD(P)-dependent oxidoreductase [Ruegeria sp. HKCCD6109]
MEQKITDSGFSSWKPSQLPELNGKTYVITGANSGIGYEAAQMLGEKGANVVMVCRSRAKGETAQRKLSASSKGKVDLILMDLSDLSSVRKAAEELRGRYTKIDGLINNAGIMMTPQEKTVDGFDLQMGANHLGHFLWTGLLLDLVEAAEGRVVVLSSLVHKYGPLDLDDFMTDTKYTPMKAYTQSKLSNLMFAFELDRRLKAAGSKAICVACHPGYTDTNLQSTGPTGFMKAMLAVMNKLVAQRPEAGAYPTVLAAAGKEAKRGAYYGPQKMGESRGPVSDAKVKDHALDLEKQRQLWAKSEQLIGFEFNLPAVAHAA